MSNLIERKCAYCGSRENLTKEHIFPNFITQVLNQTPLTNINGVDEVIVANPTIRDVCSKCNNGVLSDLDNYGKELVLKYFIHPVYHDVCFEYNYEKLLRWLLKLTYNGSRAFKSSFMEFKPYIPYILGTTEVFPYTTVLGGIIKASVYRKEVINPATISISEIIIRDKDFYDVSLSKSFYFHSYIFMIIGWNEYPSKKKNNRLITILQDEYGVELIEKDKNHINFQSSKSKIDYLSHLAFQQQVNPVRIRNIENIKKLVPNLRLFKIKNQKLEHLVCKSAIITVYDYNIPILAIEKDKIHQDLIKQVIPIEEYNNTVLNTRATVNIERKGCRTYIEIVDCYELGNPFSIDTAGVNQTNDRWNDWLRAIESNKGYIFIATLPKDYSPTNIKIVSKVKVISINIDGIRKED